MSSCARRHGGGLLDPTAMVDSAWLVCVNGERLVCNDLLVDGERLVCSSSFALRVVVNRELQSGHSTGHVQEYFVWTC